MAVSRADAIVIGAGVIGASTALELSRRGRSVICVDAGPAVGAGSTSSSSAIVRFHYSTADSVLTAWESAALWDDFAGHLGMVDEAGMAKFVRTGCLVFDYPGHNRDTVLPIFDRIGIPYDELTGAEIMARFPALDVGDFWPPKPVDDPEFAADAHGELAGYFTPDAGFIDDPMLAAVNFMAAARRRGTELRLNARVVEIRRIGEHVAGVTLANGDRIDAPVVINVAGPAAHALNKLAGVYDEMRIGHGPMRQEVHVAEAFEGFSMGNGGTIVSDVNLGTYFRAHLGNTILVGGTEPKCDELEWVDDDAEYNELPTAEGWERNMYRLARRLP